jgi:hypothetical protein
MNLKIVSLERLQEIEQERLKTQMDPNFQQWFKQMNVSRLHIDRQGIIQANYMMEDWDRNKLLKIVHTFNF